MKLGDTTLSELVAKHKASLTDGWDACDDWMLLINEHFPAIAAKLEAAERLRQAVNVFDTYDRAIAIEQAKTDFDKAGEK